MLIVPLLVLAAMPSDSPLQTPRVDVFRTGEGTHALYRIPGIVVTPRGTLLAYCEGRASESDWAAIDPMLRASRDGGRTWSDAVNLGEMPPSPRHNPKAKKPPGTQGYTINSPVMIAEPDGTVHFLYGFENERAFYRRSTDDGRTWSPSREITAAFEPLRPDTYNWAVFAIGPGHGLRLRGGRLIVPVWLSTGTGGGAHRPSVVATLYSDDRGDSWHLGEIAVPNDDDIINPSETVAEELSDGRVLLNVRSESKRHRRVQTISADGATGWSKPVYVDDLPEPICFGSLLRYDESRLLFANPDNLLVNGKEGTPGRGRERKNLTLKVSRDDGATWPARRVLDPGWAGYCDLARDADGRVLVLYERGGPDAKRMRIEALSLITLVAGELPK